jgi:hypothetical protein
MTFQDLQIQILEDVVESCPQDNDMRHQGFHFFRLGGPSRLVKRRRPEEMLETLRNLMTDDRVWPMEELLARLGWPDTYGSRKSVGLAVVLLGHKTSTQRQSVPKDFAERVEAVAFNGCTVAGLCASLGEPTTQGFLKSAGMALRKLGWIRYRSQKIDGMYHWKWRKPE